MKTRIALVVCLATVFFCGASARADDDDDEDDESPEEAVEAIGRTNADHGADESAIAAPGKLGLVQDTLRRSARTPTGFEKLSTEYAVFKKRMEEEQGLTWVFSLSYRQRWISPDDIGSAGQMLFWPSLNWEMFASDTYGAGSFQFLYYGERRSGSSVKLQAKGRTFTAELPDSRSRFSQITYTHTLPGERVAVAVGQYSFFNFDSSEFMADQQLNFVNGIFSANGSSTYPTTGVGGYIQFNATKTLQFLAGGQAVNDEDTAKRPNSGLGNSPHAWLGYAQWTPHFKGLGDAQYSLSLYQAPATSGQAPSKGWSINAVQHLNDAWVLFGRLNASHDEAGGSKRSLGLGAALNNPLGRAEADQLGIAIGSIEQRVPLLFRTLKHTQNTLEAYWNWSMLDSLLLTPDAQYIRHPAFARKFGGVADSIC